MARLSSFSFKTLLLTSGLICMALAGCVLDGVMPDENGTPVADAGGDREVLAGQAVRFDARASFDPDGMILSYHWDFGDGAESSQSAVDHVYDEPGEFTVILTVTDDRGASGTDVIVVTVVDTTRQFAVNVVVTPVEGGSVELDPPGGTYAAGTTVTLRATANEGFAFVGYSGDVVSSLPEVSVTVLRDLEVTATFDSDARTLTVMAMPENGGSVALDPPGGTYSIGTRVAMTALPAGGFEFVRFSGDITSTAATVELIVESDMTIVAEFEPVPLFDLTVTVTPAGSGTVSLDPPGGSYAEGTTVTLTALPQPGFAFVRYGGDIVGINPTVTVIVDSDMTVQAEFVWQPGLGNPGNLLVTGLAADHVVEFDRFSGALLDEIVPGSSGLLNGAGGIQFGRDGNFFVVSVLGGAQGTLASQIVEFAGTSGDPLGTFVSADANVLFVTFAFGPSGNVFAPDNGGDRILEYDGASGQLLGTFVPTGSGGLDGPMSLTFGPGGNLFVVSQGTDSVLEFDGVTGAFVRVWAAFADAGLTTPVDLAFGPGDDLFVTISGDNSVARVRRDTGQIEVFVASGSGGLSFPAGLRLHPDSGHLLVASQETDTVLEYDGSTGEFRRVFAEGSGSDNLFFMAFRP